MHRVFWHKYDTLSMSSNKISEVYLSLSPIQRKHPTMYDDFVKRKDMKREGYSSACLHSFTTRGNPCFTLPVTTGAGGGGGALGNVGGVGTLEGGEGPGAGVAKFDKHDPRQVCVTVCHLWNTALYEIP